MNTQELCAAFSLQDKENWCNAIPARYSCRSFQAQAGPDVAAALEHAVSRLSLPGVRIALCHCAPGSAPLFPIPFFPPFTGVTHYAAVIARPNRRKDSVMLAGVLGEAFVLSAASLGVSTCWVSGNVMRSKCDTPLREGEKILAIIPFGIAGENSFARKRRSLSQICKTNPNDWPLWAYNAAESVRGAPSAMNRQPWKLDFAGSTLRIDFARLNSLDTGIALLHVFSELRNEKCVYTVDEKRGALLIFRDDSL